MDVANETSDGAGTRRLIEGSLRLQLLGEHVSTEGDAAFESHSREISTLAAFRLRPCAQGRDDSCNGGANKAEETEVGPNSLNPAAIFRAVRTEMQELNYASEILTRRRSPNPGNVLHFCRKRMLDRSCDQGAAIRHKELQQEDHRAHENDSGHHRGITASRAGDRRASSGNCQKA